MGGVIVRVHEALAGALPPDGGLIEVSLGSWGMIPVELQRAKDR